MPPDLIPALLIAAEDAQRDAAAKAAEILPGLGALLAVDVLVGATVVGLALTALLFAPERHRAAGERLARAPVWSLLLGLVVLLLGAGLCRTLWLHGRPGRRFVLLLLAYAVAGGLSVSARLLGARLLPERGPVAQMLLGLAALLLPCALVIPDVMWVGSPAAFIAAAIGLGAWLTARRS